MRLAPPATLQQRLLWYKSDPVRAAQPSRSRHRQACTVKGVRPHLRASRMGCCAESRSRQPGLRRAGSTVPSSPRHSCCPITRRRASSRVRDVPRTSVGLGGCSHQQCKGDNMPLLGGNSYKVSVWMWKIFVNVHVISWHLHGRPATAPVMQVPVLSARWQPGNHAVGCAVSLTPLKCCPLAHLLGHCNAAGAAAAGTCRHQTPRLLQCA